MILSDRDLKRRLASGSIVVEPLDDPEVQIQPASIDLRLGDRFLSIDGDLAHDVGDGEASVLAPGGFALGATAERVRVPHDLVARVDGRSSVGRLAVLVHATAGFVDPGFEGVITLELANLGSRPAVLQPGMRVCRIVFHTLTSPVERPYGPERGSKYSGQDAPWTSRLERVQRTGAVATGARR